MSAHSPPSPTLRPSKRPRQSHDEDDVSPTSTGKEQSPVADQNGGGPVRLENKGAKTGGAGSVTHQTSTFRNVSACNRCRLRKNRCDQKLPACASCAKVGVACVGYDPITKKVIPRSYVYYLETRVEQLEALLSTNDIPFPPAEDLEPCSRPGSEPKRSIAETGFPMQPDNVEGHDPSKGPSRAHRPELNKTKGVPDVVGPSKPRSLASASGVSFNRVVFAAVQYSVSDSNGAPDRGSGKTTMRDSFFGLHTKPTIRPAPFPEKSVALKLVTLYFEHANPQIPILHRGEFMQMFEQAYATKGAVRGGRELYMLNMVFAIGCGVIVGEPVKSEGSGTGGPRNPVDSNKFGQAQPEEYHASAIMHLEACLGSSGGGLEALQAVLLLANLALLRPVPPGLWYIIGVAVRLAVDLGLHREDGHDLETPVSHFPPTDEPESKERKESREMQMRERGKRLVIRDMRRRLWWCTYSFDRLVSTCVGRPFGISDQVITTEFPSLLDDKYITPTGFVGLPAGVAEEPSYKKVAHHYFKLRLLQSEILQVLQYNQTQVARAAGPNSTSPDWRAHLPSPFLVSFESFRSWRIDIDKRLYRWRNSAPSKEETGAAFATEFLELNYWQAIILLYRQSLSVPAMFEGEYNTSTEVNSPASFQAELREDEDRIYLKVAEAGQKILRIYRQLHLSGLVSYTYLSTHHLFMAGISYLYAIWHSPIVRSRLTMDEVDFTVLAAKSVFTDLIDKCPPAETCHDAFDRTAKATIKMANSTGGFGAVPPRKTSREGRIDWSSGSGDGSPLAGLSWGRQPHSSHQAPFRMDFPGSEGLSSPGLSASGGDLPGASPTLAHSKTFKSDPYAMVASRQQGLSSPSGAAGLDPAMMASPGLFRQSQTTAEAGTPSAFLGQQGPYSSGDSAGKANWDYDDSQMQDFFQSLQPVGQEDSGAGAGGGDFGQQQYDFGFGTNWDNMHHDFSDDQQINIFGGYFFGSQQPQQNGGGGAGGA
ncbi:hypothetical protein ACRALDRAFT_2028751 [Sodiomyces alcalophilus JCM 7366]|uniref:uncharacterized protein n=1 Tax=Sodiomyces alcalophilus JCM 7366 TaxID=591952 RepID=UPI0039B51D09